MYRPSRGATVKGMEGVCTIPPPDAETATVPIEQNQLLRLLLANRAKLIGYIRSIVRDQHLAEDVFQDVSIIAVSKAGEIESESHLLGWLRRTARFEALNAMRKSRRGLATLDDATLELLDDHWRQTDSHDSADMTDALHDCLGELTPRSRELVDLRYSQGLSGAQLADHIGRQVNTVYVTLSRVHKQLADCIRRKLADEGDADV